MFEAKKRQIEDDKSILLAAKSKLDFYRQAAENAKTKGLKVINQSKADELAALIDIIERRCKVLTK